MSGEAADHSPLATRHFPRVTRIAALAVCLAAATAAEARAGFATSIDSFLLDPAHARQAAGFVSARTAPGDLVIASPGLAWLLAANPADFQMTLWPAWRRYWPRWSNGRWSLRPGR